MSTYLRSSFTPCWHYGYFSLHPKCLTPNRGLTEGNTHSHFTHFLSPPALPPLSGGKAGFWDMGDAVAAWPEQRRAWTSSQGQISEVCSGPKLCQIQWQQRRRTHLSPQLCFWEQQLVRWLCLGKSRFVVSLLLQWVFLRSLLRDINSDIL